MAPQDGFEPPLPVLETGVLPLDDWGIPCGATGRHRTGDLRVTSALLCHAELPWPIRVVRAAGVEPACPGWKPGARPMSHARVKLVAGAGNAPAGTGL